MIVFGIGAALFTVAEPVRDAIGERITVDSMIAANVLFYLILFAPLILLSLLLGLLGRHQVLRAGESPLGWLALGLAIGAGGLTTCVIYAWLNASLHQVPIEPTAEHHLILSAAIVLLGVAAEEFLFRGWLLGAVQDMLGSSLAVLLSAIAFSGFHWWAGGATADVVSLANLMLGGLWFGLLAERSGGIVAPMAAHFAWNASESIGFGLDPNPGVDELGALTNFDLTGLRMWGGSDEGLNASIAMTLVLAALIIPLLPAFSRRMASVESSSR
ncbi:CPBP family intramembrane glutamic endopeptidase [Novosphingobium sp. Gsoil 351]|uniref:CPBP family intramembrane glutamic endopeptidase n=1 Tax=Novosphingobium sp. Gsoil 351 TaxID=2675225 RepID=UPI0012B49BA2|nr:CPBP family intramembrane glutamic endopeptidase [Novosphingobium sp. Gsoil 351]QGN55296.1 CPBP family intramembrane metalloprotease [Novosphingobium sp. Gsoil 351]